MTFTNTQLTELDLPDIEQVNFQAVDSRYPYIAAAIAATYLILTIVAPIAIRFLTNPSGPNLLPHALRVQHARD